MPSSWGRSILLPASAPMVVWADDLGFSTACNVTFRGTLSRSVALVFDVGSLANSSIHSSSGGDGGTELLVG